jgi:hypothetical protein
MGPAMLVHPGPWQNLLRRFHDVHHTVRFYRFQFFNVASGF